MDKLTKYTNTSVIIKTNELVDEANKLKNKTEELEIKKANLKSPALTGTPTAPTPSEEINNSQIATTAFVNTKTKSLVKGPETSTNNHIAIFNGENGKLIKDSGLTIEKSVPANAKFTDTTYSNATISNDGLMSKEDKSKLDGIASGANKTVVDTALNASSTNPVQNKVINTALAGKANSSHSHSTMTGATASAAGKAGLVPTPAAGAQGKFLRGDGTWAKPNASVTIKTW